MTFNEQLNKYMEQFDCSSQDLVTASGLSSSVISRYRNGDRTPNVKSNQLEQLTVGLYKICCDKNIKKEQSEIYNTLANSLNDILISSEQLSKNFNEIISALNISVADLARSICYDASFLSKIRAGNRKPSKSKDFVEAVCAFVVSKYSSQSNKQTISLLIDCNVEDLKNQSDYLFHLVNWFSSNTSIEENSISNFLKNLDEFDLGQYIKAIHFDELKVPFVPFYKSSSKNYYGIEEMKKGELDFFKATVFSKSEEPVFMCSDMPMEDMAKDVDFGKKWMFAIAMTLKKGLHLNIIHNLDRPFNEMMLGLESWVPIYMTGQVSPYFLKGTSNSIYCHLNYVSGSVALTGECINGYHNKGKYYLTSSKSEVAYYKEKAKHILTKSTSLMDIYRAESKNAFSVFLSLNATINMPRRRIVSSLPIHTISETLLLKILKRNNISADDTKNILDAVNTQKQLTKKILKHNILEDEIAISSKEDFEKFPPLLSLADSFYEGKIYYDYNEYLEHLDLTKKYEKKVANYKLTTNNYQTFRNIQILFCGKEWVMISKISSPSIHFVIHHPKLRDAIENFIPPVVEK
jgi:DNA-binding Xre family transcriptional regulator